LESKIAFIGGGNLAKSLIRGLIAKKIAPSSIIVSNPGIEVGQKLKQEFAVETTEDNQYAALKADVIILSVKPQVIKIVAQEIASVIKEKKPLIISVAAGIDCTTLQNWLNYPSIIRAMPNTPAALGLSATGLFATASISQAQKQLAQNIFQAVGITIWLEQESQMDTVTALAGSGPAYFFLVMEILQKAGQELGLSAQEATQFVQQTALGAAHMALESSESVTMLRQRVTSPNGTTARGIQCLEQGNLKELIVAAVTAAKNRAEEITKEQSD